MQSLVDGKDVITSSSEESFHSAVSTPAEHEAVETEASPSTASSRIVSKLASGRTRRFFQRVASESSPPTRRLPSIPALGEELGLSAAELERDDWGLGNGRRVERGVGEDAITLRAFEEGVKLGGVGNVIGVYADPAAVTDDWGDDFELEEEESEEVVEVEVVEEEEDEELRMRGVGNAFETPVLTHASLVTFPGVGYESGRVHPSCTRVKELFLRYDATIRRHFDALVRDGGGSVMLEERMRQVYSMGGDADVERLGENVDLGGDVLKWKLEWAKICGDGVGMGRGLLALGRVLKAEGDVREALSVVEEGLEEVERIMEGNMALALAVELEYEAAVLKRMLKMSGAEESVRMAMGYSAELVGRREEGGDLLGPQQRGLWWQLRCKFLLAELALERGGVEEAVQYFAEYVVESITRMIGVIAPPREDDSRLGMEYMRYCLFSPRRLVLALWTTLICLGEMKCFAAAAELLSLTTLVAEAFGYEDVKRGVGAIRGRIKEISIELRTQYDEISKTILESASEVKEELDSLPVESTVKTTQIDYDVGEFGDVGDEVEEDWDAQLERELNITIQRCCDVDQSIENTSSGEGFASPSLLANEASAAPLPDRSQGERSALRINEDIGVDNRKVHRLTSQWDSGPQQGNLIEAELRQYLGRLGGATIAVSARQIFPKPTQPFDGRLMGPREHENFLRRFVRSKDPVLSQRILHGLNVSSIWEPSDACRLGYDFEPTDEIDAFAVRKDVSAPAWGVKLLDIIWKIVRSQMPLQQKQERIGQLVLNSCSKVSTAARRRPIHDEVDRQSRLDILASLLDCLRLAREIITDTGREAMWFSRACVFLGVAAATVAPAAKAAVELFQAESRAHCGVRAVTSGALLDKCAKAKTAELERDKAPFRETSSISGSAKKKPSQVPAELRQSVVDVMHALYWKTKAGFDDSSDADSFERMIHADVASSLFLTGSGISPVDGSAIDLGAERKLLHICEKRSKQSTDPASFVDETRRVSASELVQELQSLWLSLPSNAGLVRAKLSYALAHHSRVEQRDYSRAERFLFDALRSIHAVSRNQVRPHAFFSRLLLVSPISVVCSPLSEAILRSYGALALAHSKYRYGIAALEAATDGLSVRNMSRQAYRAALTEVVDASLDNNDWRRSVVLLYGMRTFVHPKDNRRNEFLHLCLRLYRVCFEVGCFEASVVPLRAYSALIYEERLRVLLHRYRRRLAKKSRNRLRRHFSSSTGASLFPNGKSALASFFETPIVNSAVESSIRHSAAIFDMRTRSTTAVVPNTASAGNGNSPLKRLVAFLWPTPVQLNRSSSIPNPLSASKERNELSSNSGEKEKSSSTQKPSRPGTGVLTRAHYAETEHFEEEQRELLRIEAEQEVTADSDRFRVELLRVQTEYAKADFSSAESRCRGLLDMRIPHACRYQVFEIMARIRLKRRELTRCLELIDQMEHEYTMSKRSREPPEQDEQSFHENYKSSIFRLHESSHEAKNEEKPALFIPQVTFLRLTALIHGGRQNEALNLADKAIDACEESSFWDLGRLHYLRGKALYEMSSCATAPFQREQELTRGPNESAQLTLRITELTMEAFEIASRYYEAAGDEICTAKSDLLWARTCIDFLFRYVVLPPKAGGGGLPLNTACVVFERQIVMEDVVDAVYGVINIATTANIPLLLTDAMAALAEIKCIQKQSSTSWMFWVLEAWKLFSRLFTDAENYTVVLGDLAPVSTLLRLRNICGRLVRLVMCDDHPATVSDTGKHLRLFEAYVTLQIAIDRKMNLSSSAHKTTSGITPQQEARESDAGATEDGQASSPSKETASSSEHKKRASATSGLMRIRIPTSRYSKDKRAGVQASDTVSDVMSEATSERSPPRRPPGAFLHILSDEGVALGRQGFSVFINRPRQQVISAVKGTGAVLIPTNFFSNSKAPPGHQLGTDAEMIFPFKPSVGLGAMQILDATTKASNEREEADYVQSFRTVLERNAQHLDANSRRETMTTFRSDNGSFKLRESVSFADEPVIAKVNSAEEVSSQVSEKQDTSEDRAENDGDKEVEGKDKNATKAAREKSKPTSRNALADLIKVVQEELEGGSMQTKSSSSIHGHTTAERVWAHMHRVKTEAKKYMHGEIGLQQLGERNSDALRSWVQCVPLSRKEWIIPESIGRRLVYILYAHGVVGYYVVDQGGSIERVAFGGKQNNEPSSVPSTGSPAHCASDTLRSPTQAEKRYLYELVHGFKREGVWHRNRDSEIVNGMANCVLRAPRILLSSSSPAQKSRSRPIVLIADLPLQILPWELFFDHVVIRSRSLLDVIRGLQDSATKSTTNVVPDVPVDPIVAAARRIARFISFGPSRREVLDLERTEEARRQQLGFQGLLRLNLMNPTSLIAFLDMGGFSDPTALNAIARPTGPLSSPLSQSRKAVKLFGLRISANIGRRNYPHVDFLKVAGLGSATTSDLKEVAMLMQPDATSAPRRDLGAYLPVFIFSYADLVDASDSVFGLQSAVPNCILMFTPAIHMKVLVRHLGDDELSAELLRASGRIHNLAYPDVTACARVLVEYVSRFSREKRIPIVVFLGQSLDVFPRKQIRKPRLVQLGL